MLRVFLNCELIVVVSSEPPFSSSSGQKDACCADRRNINFTLVDNARFST